MNPTLFRRARLLARVLSAAAALVLLSGCEGHKIVARVRNVAINENDLEDRALRSHITQGVTGLDVGGFTLVLMIKGELTHQLAKQKHADVSNEDVQTFAAFLKRMNPTYINAMNAGNLSEDEFERQEQETLENVGIGTEGAKASDQEIQAKYNELTQAAPGQRPQMMYPELWTLRRLPFGDEATAQRAIEMLNAHSAFPIVAQQLLGAPAMLAQRLTADTVFMARQIQQENPAEYAALSTLTPGQIVSKPIPGQITTQQGQPQSVFWVEQMVKQEKEAKPTLEQARPYINVVIITSTRPQWQQHATQELAAFTAASANAIQINVDRYKSLLGAYIMPQAATYAAPTAGPLVTPTPPAGGGGMAPAPGPGAGSGSAAPAPHSGSTAPAPGSGGAPSSGAGTP